MNKTILLGDFLFFGLPGLLVILLIAMIVLKVIKKRVWHLLCIFLVLFVFYINSTYSIAELASR